MNLCSSSLRTVTTRESVNFTELPSQTQVPVVSASSGPRRGTFPKDFWRIVRFVRATSHIRVLLQNSSGGRTLRLNLPRFTYLWESEYGSGRCLDTFRIELGPTGSVRRVTKNVEDGFGGESEAVIFPSFSWIPDNLRLSRLGLTAEIRELQTEADLRSVQQLSAFHYLTKDSLWGRKVFLLLEVSSFGSEPSPAGFILLTSPALLSAPRNRLMGWESADIRKKHVDRFVRVARVVVHPEFRGLGLGVDLVKAGQSYAREYWNVRGIKPWVLETVAEMSRYHPVFSKAGMQRYGQTKGVKSSEYRDPSTLENGQGHGFFKASIYRHLSSSRNPKPYYWYALDSRVRSLVSKDACGIHVKKDEISRAKAPLIRIASVSVRRTAASFWEEPRIALDELRRITESLDFTRRALGRNVSQNIRRLRRVFDPRNLESSFSGAGDSLGRRRTLHLIKELNSGLDSIENQFGEIQKTIRRQPRELRAVSNALNSLHLIHKRRLTLVLKVRAALRTLEQEISRVHSTTTRKRLSRTREMLVCFDSALRYGVPTARQEEVRKSFGVAGSRETLILKEVNLDLVPGQIVLITGASGSGKSTLLDVIRGSVEPSSGRIHGLRQRKCVGTLDPNFDPTKRLIDLVGRSTKQAISHLNTVGLSEAMVYLRRRDELSQGQRYRAAAAMLLGSGKSVWIADEFCAALDSRSTAIVASGIATLVRRLGVTFVAAVADGEQLRDALRPDVVVRMSAGQIVEPFPRIVSLSRALDSGQVLRQLQRARARNEVTETRAISSLSQLGLAKRQVGVHDKPKVVLTPTGNRIAEAGPQGRRVLFEHFYRTDLLFYRMCNSMSNLTTGDPDSHSLQAPPPSELCLEGIPWSRKGKLRQIKARLEAVNEALNLGLPSVIDGALAHN